MTGLETAHALTEKGNKVTVVEMAKEIAPGTWMQHKDDVLPKLKKAETVFLTGEKLSEIEDDAIVTENVDTKSLKRVPCDAVVLSLGSRPENALVKELTDAGMHPISIGDSVKIGRIADAVKGAYNAATKLIDTVI